MNVASQRFPQFHKSLDYPGIPLNSRMENGIGSLGPVRTIQQTQNLVMAYQKQSPNWPGSPSGPSEQRGAKTTLDGYILTGQNEL